jgi:hypothetical protein
MTQICKLCQLEKQLRRSHILPEFMYQNLYDENPRRFHSLNVDLDDISKSSNKIEQKGIREFLLCDQCEGLISKHEKYAAETIYAKNDGNKAYIINASKTDDGQYTLYDYAGFSYKQFKLFLLSILWRMLISEKFTEIKGEEEILERLRVAILTEDPLQFDDFGCLIQVIRYNEEQLAAKFILSPYLTKDANSLVINQLVDGLMYSFYFNSKDLTITKKDVFLKEDGTMKIIGRIIFNDPQLLESVMKAYQYYDSLKK